MSARTRLRRAAQLLPGAAVGSGIAAILFLDGVIPTWPFGVAAVVGMFVLLWQAGRAEARGSGIVEPVEPAAGCPFCAIVAGTAPATVVRRWDDAIAIVPLNPVVEGHILIIPHRHVEDYTSDPEVTAAVMRRAAEIGPFPSNLITSAGEDATQSVKHLHAHVVPRRPGDGLLLPWTPQQEAARRAGDPGE